MENTITIKCDKNWILQGISPWDYSNKKRRKNYLAVVTKDDKGELNCKWLKEGEDEEYFNITDVNIGDVLMAGYKDYYKARNSEKLFYKVMDKTDDSMILAWATTYRKALGIGALD